MAEKLRSLGGITVKDDFSKDDLQRMDHVIFLKKLFDLFGQDIWTMRLSVHPPFWDRWMKYSEIIQPGNERFLASVNQRQILDNEVCIDCDLPKFQFNERMAKSFDKKYICVPFYSGGKGIHMSYFFEDPNGYLPLLKETGLLSKWKARTMAQIDVRGFIEGMGAIGAVDQGTLNEKHTINLEFAFNRKEDAKKKVPLIPFDPGDTLPLNRLDDSLIKELMLEEETILSVPPSIYSYAGGKRSKKCNFVEYCFTNPIKDFRKRAAYFLAARLKRNGLTADQTEEKLQEFKKINTTQDYKELSDNYISGIVKYVYATEKTRGCSSLMKDLSGCNDKDLVSFVKKCSCQKNTGGEI